ncbi:MAG TPA: SUMF1/EgtB/PvdO family nonheme iron enzyme [Vicinamibacterales bacterium]|nr:SUMF1/EgtB/PvdO family nonheme iron enzyme [Vicinamibacterales bacterium]
MRSRVLAWYRRTRARSRALFDLLVGDDAYYSQPIGLRHPIVFYDGHLSAFSFNTLVKTALGGRSIDPELERLFARGIDPDGRAPGPEPPAVHRARWPDRTTVRAFADEADRRVLEALGEADLEVPGHPLLDRAEAVFTIVEHEVMHQETLLYLWHRLPAAQKRCPSGYRPVVEGRVPPFEWIAVPPGRATLGVDREAVLFGWDNEFPRHEVDVAAFEIARHDVTNAEYLEFVEAGGYRDPRWWRPDDWAWLAQEGVQHPPFWERDGRTWSCRGMFDRLPLPMAWPVYVTHAEASAYALWRGARLPTEAEFQRAAYGTPGGAERRYPWGDEVPARAHGVFDFRSWDPEPAGSHPAGASAWGVEDLVGNGWEWTSTIFHPFPGFRPMASYPQYSADFFDGEHVVLKGASPATGHELLRPTFRNWFRGRYPYVYATFRCARGTTS